MLQIDDIVGTYTSHTPSLTTTLQHLTVQPEGAIVLQGENNTNNIVESTFNFTDSGASTSFSAEITTVDGPSTSITAILGFSEASGTWGFSGSLAVNAAAPVPYYGSNTNADLTQANLDKFKAMFPNNPQVQAVTLSQVLQFGAGKPLDGSGATLDPVRAHAPVKRGVWTECQWECGAVVYDCVCIVTGMIGLKGLLRPAAQAGVVAAVAPHVAEIEKWAQVLSSAASSGLDKAKAVFAIAKLVWTGGMFEAIWTAITSSLNWWDMILYGVLGLAEITAVFLTDGAATIALIVAEIALIGFLVSDSIKLVNACFSEAEAEANA